ncbi:MAG: hypothetical protein K2H98_01375, partial [Duncaniella sp.]|nr:hypothetical protein [Duncaniella sp.]
MLINLNEEIFGFVPVEPLPQRVDDTPGRVEYYLGFRPDDKKLYLLMACRDATVVSDELTWLESEQHKLWYAARYQAYYGDNINILAIEMPEKTTSLATVLETGPMRWDVALPLFYEILMSRLDTAGEERFFRSSLSPDNIMVVSEGADIYPFAPYIPAWDIKAANRVHLFTAPELLSGDSAEGPDETTWLYSAAALLTMMLQSRYPRKLDVNPEKASREDFISDYVRTAESAPEIDAIGPLRKVLAANISARREDRSESVNDFLHAIYAIIKEKGMK